MSDVIMGENANGNIDLDPQDQPIWGAKAIAEAIHAPERKVWHLIRTKQIPINRCGDRIFTTLRALRKRFAVEA